MNEPGEVVAVLHRVRLPAEIGAAARAVKNMGIDSLRLVAPPPHYMKAAATMAHGAVDILESAEIYADLATAVADSSLVIATFVRNVVLKPEHIYPREAALLAANRAVSRKVILLFGESDEDLTAEEEALIHYSVYLPRAAACHELGIAQAVLVLGYEAFLTQKTITPPIPAPMASVEQSARFFAEFREILEQVEFIPPGDPDMRMLLIRKLFGRAGLTTRDVGTWLGICRRLREFLKSLSSVQPFEKDDNT